MSLWLSLLPLLEVWQLLPSFVGDSQRWVAPFCFCVAGWLAAGVAVVATWVKVRVLC